MVTAILWRRAMVFAVVVIAACATAQAEDTASSITARLKAADSVCLQQDTHGNLAIYLYTTEDLVQIKEYRQKYVALKNPLAEATKNEDQNKIAELKEQLSKLKAPPLAHFGDTQKILSVGSDSFECKAIFSPDVVEIIPFHKIARIYQQKPAAKESPASAKAN